MSEEMTDEMRAGIERLIAAVASIEEGHDLMDIQETCCALEEVSSVLGVTLVSVVTLRRELEKRGLRRV